MGKIWPKSGYCNWGREWGVARVGVLTHMMHIKVCIMMAMDFTWHEDKRRSNLKKHGLDFADAEQVFAGLTLTREDPRHYDERRFNTTGFLGAALVTICHTETEHEIRIISMRKAEPHEIEHLFGYL